MVFVPRKGGTQDLLHPVVAETSEVPWGEDKIDANQPASCAGGRGTGSRGRGARALSLSRAQSAMHPSGTGCTWYKTLAWTLVIWSKQAP